MALEMKPEGVRTVSYTHLDVYKRQSYLCVCVCVKLLDGIPSVLGMPVVKISAFQQETLSACIAS